MNELELPRQLNGPWNHCLILTYTIDIPFFENALWREFAKSCRNKVLLADGQEFLTACKGYTETGIVHLLNQQYIAEGIFSPHRAHAKAILLTNAKQGRLLVGSGNLGLQGYAGGGELFTQYEYNDGNTESLGAFIAIRELVERIIKRGYILGPARERIRALLDETPWLFQKPPKNDCPVRHNLEHTFLEQLSRAVQGKRIEELWILSPFFDREALALRTMIDTFKPKHCFVLIQPGQTSIDPKALRAVMDHFGKSCEVRPIGFEDGYVHAKMYLLKLSKLAICMHGSPNLSQSAMLKTVPDGNIEVANLHTASRNDFDEILHRLKIGKAVKRLDALELTYHPTDNRAEQHSPEFCLISGEWREDRLRMNFRGTIENRRKFTVMIDSRKFTLSALRCDAQSVELKLTDEAARLLARPVPVAISWRGGQDSSVSNPIFVCNRVALENVLQQSDTTSTLGYVADLELEDEEIESLLLELENTLIIDHRSIWQMAGHSSETEDQEDEEAIQIDYSEIDYERFRHHPKLQQYLRRTVGNHEYTHSRLQVILDSITNHFRTLMDTPDPTALSRRTVVINPTRAETEEERVQEIEEQQQRQRRAAPRIRRLLTNFISRYLRGIQNREFQEMAGFEVIAQNYIIFAHLLWKLLTKDWVDPDFLVDSLIGTWKFFWGTQAEAGYFWKADTEHQSQGLGWISERSADAEFLAALWYCYHLAQMEHSEEQLFALRDIWQGVLLRQPFATNRQILEKAWRAVIPLNMHATPSVTQMVDELATLAEFETRESLKKRIEDKFGFPANTCDFDKQTVFRSHLEQADEVDCLIVHSPQALSDMNAGLSLLAEWMRVENLDYYRIVCPANGRILFYDKTARSGRYWARDLEQEAVDFGPIQLPARPWDPAISEMRRSANKIMRLGDHTKVPLVSG